jgi:hypothetical protein
MDNRRLAHLDADRLVEEFGQAAYEVAWTMSREVRNGAVIDSRPDGHWDRVLRVIARRDLWNLWARRRAALRERYPAPDSEVEKPDSRTLH